MEFKKKTLDNTDIHLELQKSKYFFFKSLSKASANNYAFAFTIFFIFSTLNNVFNTFLKSIFNKAASLNIGLIPSVFWTRNLQKVYGEKAIAWGDPTSQTWQAAMEWQTILLDNFNDHPALFFWENGNEWNCEVDVSTDADLENRFNSNLSWYFL